MHLAITTVTSASCRAKSPSQLPSFGTKPRASGHTVVVRPKPHDRNPADMYSTCTAKLGRACTVVRTSPCRAVHTTSRSSGRANLEGQSVAKSNVPPMTTLGLWSSCS